ncbi:ribulokinase [Feifania hominis]|uniref:Ribulokinase n=1 Tax=Feifania hominis TaxID=2763660 RepID=A0A926HSV4_9FIRM|nr:ribulokinase [Feifania hominis]MBC8535219.1 ribulokinase [Feifania hominis]
MSEKYSIGVDYGTKSARALLLNLNTGEELAVAEREYPHGVIDEVIPGVNIKLPVDWALELTDDFLEVFVETVSEVMRTSGVNPADVIGIGTDFTSCSILPIDENGTPLYKLERFKTHPHAYPKLWKHHAAQPEANRLNEIASERGEDFMRYYGGKQNSEWMIPKVMQVLDEDEEVYNAADRFIECGDYLTMELTGKLLKSSSQAGYKSSWSKRTGFPSEAFFKALDPRMEHLASTKLRGDIGLIGDRVGGLKKEYADRVGLPEGVAVGVSIIDSCVSACALGVVEAGTFLMNIGTSTCHTLLATEDKTFEGILGLVEDGIIRGFYGYETGQACVGDHFDWFVKNCVPASYHEEAKSRGLNIHKLLREKASAQKPGESGLVALDWWNGNRSILVDADLTGMIVGMTLLTRPEEIYRALIEATAYGTRVVVDNYRKNEVPIKRVLACGGIAQKDPMMMQIYADVINMEIGVSYSTQAPARGAAMWGAVAAGADRGGFDSIIEASEKLALPITKTYSPIPENVAVYEELFAEYMRLHDYFGRGGNDVMKRLKEIKKRQS